MQRILSRTTSSRHITRGSLMQFRPGCVNSQSISSVASAVPHLVAPNLASAQHLSHVRNASEILQNHGILKISLRFEDRDCQYLESLILNFHKHHGHGLPISHSATRGWFWDVRPSTANFQTKNYRARSETMEDFPWHTDCSYENPTPRFFALQVLQPDRCGGGTLSVLNVEQLSHFLSQSTLVALFQPEYSIAIPPEFIKDANEQNIVGSILAADGKNKYTTMRYRRDIITPMSVRAEKALYELERTLQQHEVQSRAVLHLTPDVLPGGSIILLDNRRWLHARNEIHDPGRHLRRVRWNSVPFLMGEMCDDQDQ
ncbi:uncharacterized protein N7503_009600 [Penicillium pulvis]|uniref:uncharacterized protein n=1 Tax=Penicillium pulvis TaxID=1562058 RepID=UPI00254811BB|nr:uncharacterized protein N7503_009600 [Penicillium pulvis]KAJ5784388.1 hypothetical protein N7503_009600 [Penicillium pulvis]